MPGLDGLRAVAVLGVIGYHIGIDSLPGGLLGVSVFFTLSGYLITDLLLNQLADGGIRLRQFWLARARRLLPALFLMLILVMAWTTVIGPHQPADFRTAALTAAAYVNNWWLIFHDVSYFAQFNAPEPLNHLWSLSIEEQFYIIWPFVLLLGAKLIPEIASPAGVRLRLGAMTLGLALVSGILMFTLYEPGIDPSRVYYGTDTRALELLVGASLATIWPSRKLAGRIAPGARMMIDGWGVAGLVVIGLMYLNVDPFSPFLYRGGFLLLSIATALTVAALAHPASRLGPLLGTRVLRWIGVRSYGIYLWHFPIIILTTPEGAEPGLIRGTLQVAATFGIAALSWKYVEDPIRHGAIRRLWADYKAGRWRRRRLSRTGWATVGGAGAVCLAAFAGFMGVGTAAEPEREVGEISVATTLTSGDDEEPKADRVACREVIHIGDSTSEGLVSSDYLPNPKDQVAARYGKVGAKTQHLEVSGARSIYERFQGTPNAHDVALTYKQNGFDGCWVLAMGTNEAANVAAGSTVTWKDRIDTMMDAADGQPVLWVNVRTLLGDSSPYAESNMKGWNQALLQACSQYPNMRIFDWAGVVKDRWFVEDGIHFTTEGYKARARLIAKALLEAFPAGSDPEAPAEGEETTTTPEGEAPEGEEEADPGGGSTSGSRADCLIDPTTSS